MRQSDERARPPGFPWTAGTALPVPTSNPLLALWSVHSTFAVSTERSTTEVQTSSSPLAAMACTFPILERLQKQEHTARTGAAHFRLLPPTREGLLAGGQPPKDNGSVSVPSSTVAIGPVPTPCTRSRRIAHGKYSQIVTMARETSSYVNTPTRSRV